MRRDHTEKNGLLVTGMGGMVGRVVARLAVENGYRVAGTTRTKLPSLPPEVVSYQVDLRDEAETSRVFDDAKPDYIVNLAGIVAGQSSSPTASIYTDNITIMESVLASAQKLNNNDLLILHASAAIVYGPPHPAELVEESAELPPADPEKQPYQASKTAQEIMLADSRLNYVTARPAQHTGPGRILGVVETDIAAQIVGIKNDQRDRIEVRNKKAEISMLDVRDVAVAYLLLIQKGDLGKSYNVAAEQPTSVHTLARLLLQVAALQPENYPIISTKEEKITYSRFSTERLQKLGWSPRYSVVDALTSFWKDFESR